MNYSEKLRSPLWQKRRLEVFNRDNFTCTLCGDSDSELHVHHEEYSGEPWEAPIDKLKTLCKYCHKVVEELKTIPLHIHKVYKKRHRHCYVLYLLAEHELKNVIAIIKVPYDTQEPEFATGMEANLIDSFYEFVHLK